MKLRNFLAIFVLALVSLSLVSGVWAQAETTSASEETPTAPVIRDTPKLQLALVKSFQNPETKDLKFELVMYSQITTDRVTVDWRVTGGSEIPGDNDQSGRQNLTVRGGGVYRVPVTIRPRAQGLSNIRFTVQAFEADGTLTSTAAQDIFSDRTGAVVPVASQVTIMQLTGLIRGIGENGAKISALLLILFFAYKYYRKWMRLDA